MNYTHVGFVLGRFLDWRDFMLRRTGLKKALADEFGPLVDDGHGGLTRQFTRKWKRKRKRKEDMPKRRKRRRSTGIPKLYKKAGRGRKRIKSFAQTAIAKRSAVQKITAPATQRCSQCHGSREVRCSCIRGCFFCEHTMWKKCPTCKGAGVTSVSSSSAGYAPPSRY